MGNSFKLQKGGSAKSQALNGGILLVILGILAFFIVNPIAGLIFGILGFIFVLAGLAASE